MRLLCFYNHFFTILSVLSHSSSICTCRVYFSERDLGRQLAFNVPVRLPASSSSNKPTAVAALTGSTDKRPKKYICQRVKPHMHGDDIGRHNPRVGRIHNNTFVFDATGQVDGEQSQCQLRVAIYRNAPKATLPSPEEKSGKSR